MLMKDRIPLNIYEYKVGTKRCNGELYTKSYKIRHHRQLGEGAAGDAAPKVCCIFRHRSGFMPGGI